MDNERISRELVRTAKELSGGLKTGSAPSLQEIRDIQDKAEKLPEMKKEFLEELKDELEASVADYYPVDSSDVGGDTVMVELEEGGHILFISPFSSPTLLLENNETKKKEKLSTTADMYSIIDVVREYLDEGFWG